MAKNEISLIIRKKLKIQNTKTLLKNASDINISIKEHLLKLSIKEMIKIAPINTVVLNKMFEHQNSLKVATEFVFFLKT